ncbi:MAG: hydrolase [Candidatus Paceibacterota bacterium]
MQEENIQECCPRLNVEKWDKKIFNWSGKQFIKETIPTFFHIPFSPMIGEKLTKMMKLIENTGKIDENREEILVLFQDPSAFKSNLYISVTGEVEGANNIRISGIFMAKVYDGGYNEVPNFIKDMNMYLEKEGKSIPKSDGYYIHYAYCPKCEKKYGKNYMILFAKIG